MIGTTTAVLLAAGAGRRLGRGPKALLPFRGRPLIEHQVAVLLAGGCTHVVAVLGAGSADILASARLQDAAPVVNPQWELGMGTSYRCGILAALAREPETSVLVALVDQPGLTPAVVSRVLAAGQPGRITAAGYRAPDGKLRRGHPVLLDASLAARSLEPEASYAGAEPAGERRPGANPDSGARAFLAAHPELLHVVDCTDLADGRDVDCDADLALLD
ncbi:MULTISPECIES: NTP transferase domain-containing protein [unclassified Arthrobacter]|uniref:nucleotidyltransferase family protein n=1 Tax=unclassified Arthrobacter TaxID=235627 RepID=UPI00210840E5|nr:MULTISPECIES: nucleotidyltransferase family protein [unclassified Arthrobacter]MCQ1985636.1 nucleotidyltransferase family protein [Arthrobacter sp. zg-Y844]MCQ1994647.1 nucleotidyltransferase family protein [Arthrobacter sp. zg-Y1171]UWX81274.1 nucleotidyltransferase family protein [Arthrobacter sp. zg-Y1171]